MYSRRQYHNEDFEEYIANPKAAKQEADMYSSMEGTPVKCIPVGINNTYMPLEKDGADNLDMAQYNIRDRFGYLSEDDRLTNEPE